MKRLILLLAIILPCLSFAQGQQASIKIGGGYAHDFPGLNGSVVFGEYNKSLLSNLQIGVGGKWSNLQGFPRTDEVKEFTKAVGLDFNIYFVPVNTESQQFRAGVGYSFSFYQIRRAYPIVVNNGTTPEIKWPIQDNKGRISGLSLFADYEYLLPNTNFSLGIRGSYYKGYDYITSIGMFVGFRIP